MKLTKTLKRFWTMQKQTGGFTLVELIVVIAILAILAGVAIPAYSGYITKANEAADRQLLSAINRAFAAACNTNGFSPLDVKTAEIAVDADGKLVSNARAAVNYITKAEKQDGTVVTDVLNESFATFFAGNENAAFKTVKSQKLPFANGAFGLPGEGGGSIKVTFGGVEFYISQEAAQKLANSTFGTEIGSEALLGKVDAVSGIAAGMINEDDDVHTVIEKILFGSESDEVLLDVYASELAESLNLDEEEVLTKLEAMTPEEKSNFMANSLVLSAAKKTEGMDTSFLSQEGGFINDLKTDLNNPETATDALAQAAMAYGMYTAYANYTKDPEMLKKIEDIEKSGNYVGMVGLMTELESDEFQKYLEDDAGQADLAAYQSAMGIINQGVAESPDAAMGILTGGFNNDELAEQLGNIMGK